MRHISYYFLLLPEIIVEEMLLIWGRTQDIPILSTQLRPKVSVVTESLETCQ